MRNLKILKLDIKTMKVILKQNVNKLGKKGDVKNVSNGYGRNFLIPNGYAVLASNQEINKVQEEKNQALKEAETELNHFQNIVSEIDGFELEMPVKTNEEGGLFGSVTNKHIAESLKQEGFEVDKKYIKLESPIKEIGEYDLNLEFPHNLEANIKVIITEGND